MRYDSIGHKLTLGTLACAASLLLVACGSSGGGSTASTSARATGTTGPGGKTTFTGANATFNGASSVITNPWLPISKFQRCVLTGNDQGQQLRIVRTLQSRTQPFTYQGQTVNAAVVDDNVTDLKAGQVIERTVDYFAEDEAGNVYYFGEDVSEYKNGKLANHEGQWRLGRDTQTPGALMPADPKLGNSFQSEDVKGITKEVDHVVATGRTAQIGGHTYRNVMKVRENAGPPPEVEYKTYSPGTGVITEANGGVHLVSCA
jgi:hypothetical protein